ncbi:hypothetical protein [Streptomyces sp. NPDC101115]|uniref:hypothetical protein n=1 Tax=Streptomyces sp. NPDC101115 TaxID=3366106 RepID=UPI0037F42B3A
MPLPPPLPVGFAEAVALGEAEPVALGGALVGPVGLVALGRSEGFPSPAPSDPPDPFGPHAVAVSSPATTAAPTA